jgi:hypothetical protein
LKPARLHPSAETQDLVDAARYDAQEGASALGDRQDSIGFNAGLMAM